MLWHGSSIGDCQRVIKIDTGEKNSRHQGMNEPLPPSPPIKLKLSDGQFVGGVVTGIAVGYALTSEIHKHFPIAEIGIALPLLSFVFFMGGLFYALYSKRREAIAVENQKNVA
jgi:hypothetical protein